MVVFCVLMIANCFWKRGKEGEVQKDERWRFGRGGGGIEMHGLGGSAGGGDGGAMMEGGVMEGDVMEGGTVEEIDE